MHHCGFKAMMDGAGDVVAWMKNKLQSAIATVTPSAVLAEQHRKMAEPGSAQQWRQVAVITFFWSALWLSARL
jgi:hypothetical protein